MANVLRLLKLPEEVRSEVASGRLSMGHARALLSLTSDAAQRDTARDVIARNLSVREWPRVPALVDAALDLLATGGSG